MEDCLLIQYNMPQIIYIECLDNEVTILMDLLHKSQLRELPFYHTVDNISQYSFSQALLHLGINQQLFRTLLKHIPYS